MKKIFEAEYGSDLAEEIEKWIKQQTISEEGSVKVYRPYAIVELFDQNGEPVTTNNATPRKI